MMPRKADDKPPCICPKEQRQRIDGDTEKCGWCGAIWKYRGGRFIKEE